MTINELKTGNIIINRGGYLGVVLKDNDYILYQEIGMDDLNDFNEDLTIDDEFYPDGDIMEVYEGGSFIDYEGNTLLYRRDPNWIRPTAEERRAREEQAEIERQKWIEKMKKEAEEARRNCIFIITQHFYGNRTGTEIERDEVDYFLHGHHSRELFRPEDIADMDRRVVHVPGSEHIVIVYDQTKEDKYINVDFPEEYERIGARYRESTGRELTMQVSCEIPETGFKIHTRCFACRMDENGELQSLEDDDYKHFIHYFPER